MSGHVVAINDAIRWLRALPDASVDLVIRCRRVPKDEREHPTQKDLLLTLMRPHVVSGGVVADPFAGSGSVIGAASRLGAVAWCCDADPERLPAMRCRAEYSGVPQTLPGMDP